MNKIVFVGFSFQHHRGTHAGYNQIGNYINYDYIIDIQKYHDKCCALPTNLISRIYRNIIWRIFGFPAIPFYLLKCILLGLLHKDLTFHFIYGENSYHNFTPFIRSGNRVVCTFHQPVEWFKGRKWEKRLKSLNKIIILSNKEIEDFKAITGKDNVIFLPHGISTEFYRPDESICKEKILLTVGNWLRDYKFANGVYQGLLKKDTELKIVVVSNKENLSLLSPHERLFFLHGISDEELKNLYLRSSVLFLPLIRYTANNSLLEAGACGCNIVISSDAQDNSYIPEELLNLCIMNKKSAIETIYTSLNYSYNLKLADFINSNYSWEVVASMVEEQLR